VNEKRRKAKGWEERKKEGKGREGPQIHIFDYATDHIQDRD